MSRRCAECAFPAAIGSRCGSHWIDRVAKSRIKDWLWWKNGPVRQNLIQRIAGRYTAIVEGFPVPPAASIFEGLRYRKDEFEALTEIVNIADASARREHAATAGTTGSDRDPQAGRGVGERDPRAGQPRPDADGR